jgi:hypothetical protein
MHYGHGRRNNEPYMQPLAEADLPALLRKKGFTEVEITPFQESPGAVTGDKDAWRFPWSFISARKPLRVPVSAGRAAARSSGGKRAGTAAHAAAGRRSAPATARAGSKGAAGRGAASLRRAARAD